MRKDRNMKKIKIGIVGLGSMGTAHRLAIEALDDFELAAICDIEESKWKDFKDRIPCFTDYPAMLAEAALDAVTVATPHWFHPEIGTAALDAGKHVLIEKPIGVHVSHARKLLDAIARHPELKAAAMFNQRRIEAHRRLKSLIDGGELGKILRISWIITDWFRTQRYYDSGDWRASWRGEGGGVLINQCPHQLDLMQWFFGMPERVTAFMSFGKYHRIEVEDEVTAYLEYPDGATGVFVTSTGEAPGTNRLEIAAERGRVILENGRLEFLRNEVPVSEFCRNSTERFAMPPRWNCMIPGDSSNPHMHRDIIENFGKAILYGEPLTACASEGIRGLALGNAMLLSALEKRGVSLPLDEECLAGHFDRLTANSRYRKQVILPSDNDFVRSFSK